MTAPALHIPVLLDEVIDALAPALVDLGHAADLGAALLRGLRAVLDAAHRRRHQGGQLEALAGGLEGEVAQRRPGAILDHHQEGEGVAGEAGTVAEVLPATAAIPALPTGPPQPGDADPLAALALAAALWRCPAVDAARPRRRGER